MTLESYPLPEMLRSRLDEVIMKVKMLQLGSVRPFLNRVMNPPDPLAVNHSLEVSFCLSFNFNCVLCSHFSDL